MKNHYRFLALLISCTLACAAPISALGSEVAPAGETAVAAEETAFSETETAAEAEPDTAVQEEEPSAVVEEATEEPEAAAGILEDGNEEPEEVPVGSDEPEVAAPVTEGYCGEKLTWEYKEGRLYIEGTGEMYDYDKEKQPEWNDNAGLIEELHIGKGITLIDGDAFEKLKELRTIYFEGSEKEWRELAYENDREDREPDAEEAAAETVGENGMKEVFTLVTEYYFGEETPEPVEASEGTEAPEGSEEEAETAEVPGETVEGVGTDAAMASAESLQIVTEPDDISAAVGETVSLYVEVNTEEAGYQWQWSADGTSWRNCKSAGNDTDTFSFEVKETLNGRKYRCIVTSGSEVVMTRTATVTVTVTEEELEITSQPADVTAAIGEEVSLHVEANRADTGYQWQWSADGENWRNCKSAGFDTDTFTFTMKATLNGRQYRCIVTSGSEEVMSEVAVVSIEEDALEITGQPEDVTASAGQTVSFHVEVNKGGATYQWQWSADGNTWKDCRSTGYNTDTMSFSMRNTYSGRQYRCIVTSGTEQVTSGAATVTYAGQQDQTVTIVSQPEDVEASDGEEVNFHVVADRTDVTYQWQWSADGTAWKNCTSAGYNTDTMHFVMREKFDGRQYRCIVTSGSRQAVSEAATVTLAGQTFTIVAEPEDVEASDGEEVNFHVEADRTNVTYQWQWSADGTTWKNCTSAGYNTDTMHFVMREKFDGRQYRCIVASGAQSVTTRAAQLTFADPEIVIEGVVYKLIDGVMTVIGYRGTSEDVVVQEMVEGHTVTVIGETAFEGSTIRSIDLPDTIQLIKRRAFAGCSNLTNME